VSQENSKIRFLDSVRLYEKSGGDVTGKKLLYLKALYESSRELSSLDDRNKIIEAFLLMSMGPLGASSGFVFYCDLNTGESVFFGRGLDDPDNLLESHARKFITAEITDKSKQASEHSPQIIFQDQIPEDSLLSTCMNCLVQWRSRDGAVGLLGFGKRIMAGNYECEDVEFILNLTNCLVNAVNHAHLQRAVKDMGARLKRKKTMLEETISYAGMVRKDLDRRVYNLQSLYDASRELSGLLDIPKMMDAFLLMLMGAFSLDQGFIVFYDYQDKKHLLSARGVNSSELKNLTRDTAAKTLVRLSAGHGNRSPLPMHAAIQPQKTLADPILGVKCETGVFFALTECCTGFIGLGKKIDETQYSQDDRDLLSAHVNNFLVFLKNAKNFSTIQSLNQDLGRRNLELETTLNQVDQYKNEISFLTKAKDQVSSVIFKRMDKMRKVSALDIALILVLGICIGLLFNYTNPHGVDIVPDAWTREPVALMDAQRAKLRYDSGAAVFIDARPAQFYELGHVKNAVNMPPALFDFLYPMHFMQTPLDRQIIVYGRNISKRYDEDVAYLLESQGHSNVVIMKGGLKTWRENDYPVE